MILYGGSPDQLAQQQQAYDALYGNFGNANANRQQQAYDRSYLGQAAANTADINDQRADIENNQKMAFDAREGALNRAAAARNVDVQYGSTAKHESDAQNDRDFQFALSAANTLPSDKDALKKLYPNFSSDKINQLFQYVSGAKLDQFVREGQNAFKAGNPLKESDILDYGIEKDTPLYAQALQHVKVWQTPQVEAHNEQQSYADSGNRIARILADRQAIADNPVTYQPAWKRALLGASGVGLFYTDWRDNPSGLVNYEPVQANPEAVNRLAQIQQNLAPTITPGLKTSMVTRGPSGDLSAITPMPGARPSWLPPSSTPPVPASVPPSVDAQTALQQAQLAIARGADPVQVKARLLKLYGIQM